MSKTILKNKMTGQYGTLEYSMFGGSIHYIDEEDGILGKGLGQRIEAIMDRWEVVDLPEGYEIGEWGGVRKIS